MGPLPETRTRFKNTGPVASRRRFWTGGDGSDGPAAVARSIHSIGIVVPLPTHDRKDAYRPRRHESRKHCQIRSRFSAANGNAGTNCSFPEIRGQTGEFPILYFKNREFTRLTPNLCSRASTFRMRPMMRRPHCWIVPPRFRRACKPYRRARWSSTLKDWSGSSARLGQEGVELHKRARGAGSRPLVSHVDPLRFVDVIELDYEIVTIEPLTFILSRMLDGICARLRSRNLATHEVRLALGTYVRVLNLPLPVRNPKVLARLLILDLEAHPPGVGIRRVEIEAVPAKPRVVQNGLFVPLSPEPEKLELTLARVKAVVGEENVGAAEIEDTHRPDGFRVKKFGVVNESSPPKLGGEPSRRRGG